MTRSRPSIEFASGQLASILALCLGMTTALWADEPASEDFAWGHCSDSCCDWGDDHSATANWIVGANVLLLERSTPDSLVLMQDTIDPTRNLNADDFNFDWETGWEFSLARRLSNGDRLEARFMSVDSWNSLASAATNSTLLNPLRINTNPPTFAGATQTINASYGSDLQSLELNYEMDMACWNWLAGFRYIELDEHLHSTLNAAPQFFTYDTSTRNRMYGFQTGGGGAIWSDEYWTVDGVIKAGIFHNSQGHASVLNTGVAQAAANDADRVAFVGELRFTVNYDVTDQLAVRFGYDLLWLETVALASDQIPATDLFTGTGIAADGGVFYQGAFAGLEYRH